MTSKNCGLEDKLDGLRQIIGKMESVVVCMSGGVDSVFLAIIAHQVLQERALAVTADSPSLPRRELEEADRLAHQYGFQHQIIRTGEMSLPEYISNPVNRCYFCKNKLFEQMNRIARAGGFRWVCYGENIDDQTDHRPGGIAAQEHRVRAPLKEAGLTKSDIRLLAQSLGLPIWDKPAMACLASRIPYGVPITAQKLTQIESAENFLADLGFRQSRVRHHGEVARIEVEVDQMQDILPHAPEITAYFQSLGFTFVAMDLTGYRRGSMNENQILIQLEPLEASVHDGATQ
jgi:uncharacterized protein